MPGTQSPTRAVERGVEQAEVFGSTPRLDVREQKLRANGNFVRPDLERRAHVRRRVSRVEVRVASQEAFRASYLRDLSMGGLFVRCRQPLPQGTPVVVELWVEQQDPVRLRGEVTRLEHSVAGAPRGFGVRFSTVDADTRTSLERILRGHQLPESSVATDAEALRTQLAEARGNMEAYEETLALLRESETELAQRLEATEAERGVLVSVAQELQSQVLELEAERATLLGNAGKLMQRLSRDELELQGLRETTARLTTELRAARQLMAKSAIEHESCTHRLLDEFEAELERAEAQKREFDAEVQAIRAQLEAREDGPLRAELHDVAAQLDEERLKSLALERALNRFV